MSAILSYVSLNSLVSPSFWCKLSELKIDVYKSEEMKTRIWGYKKLMENGNFENNFLEVDSTSFNKEFDGQKTFRPFHGSLSNANTIERFREIDKQRLLNEEGAKFKEKMERGEVAGDPSALDWFVLLTFADLKKYQYFYWFAFPVPKGISIEKIGSREITDEFSEEMLADLEKEYEKLEAARQSSYFVVLRKWSALQATRVGEAVADGGALLRTDGVEAYYAFQNGGGAPVAAQLRNYVALLLHHCPFLENREANFLCLNWSRGGGGRPSLRKSSVVLRLKLPKGDSFNLFNDWVGWEKNEKGNMGPRMANMRTTLDPAVIAETSVDLNLKLMKWNLVPDIDLEKIKKAKCLLLGAGTLGCSVARTLLGWGVRRLTFVDDALVSSSNPVRQSLFTYRDSLENKPKAKAAADMVAAIFPGAISEGHRLKIPMPGHPVAETFVRRTEDDVRKLTDLIGANDIVFLLTDSRESRWLPTLLAAERRKIVVNAALGFDSYLVMRHGVYGKHDPEKGGDAAPRPPPPPLPCPDGYKAIEGCDLGCYFCTDVSAPGDSLKNRTLDQQCTVTRPGVSQIAGALAAEMAVSLLQHERGICAPAFYACRRPPHSAAPSPDDPAWFPSILGPVPHSIRGFLSSAEQFSPATEKYGNCVACSELVVGEYRRGGAEFLRRVFDDSRHLEEVALVSQTMGRIETMDEILEYGTDEEFSVSSSDQ